MKATMQDTAFVKHAGQFVWLSLDYDDRRNEPFFKAHDTNGALPAFLVLDPESDRLERVLFGGARVADMERFLDDNGAGAADAALQRGDALVIRGQAKEALAAYREALTLGGAGWPHRDHGVEQLAIALLMTGDYAGCTTLVAREAPSLPRTRAFISTAIVALDCKDAASDGHSEAEERLAREAMALPIALEDDRYVAYDALIMAHRLRGDTAGVQALATEYLALVEQAPTGAGDRRMGRDFARLRAAVALGDTARVIPALAASDRVLADGDSAARLARAYANGKRWADAIAACTRGLARPAGPMARARLLRVRAEAERAVGDVPAARRDLEAILHSACEIPIASSRAPLVKQVQGELDQLH